MSHALTTHLLALHLYTALVTDNSLKTDAFIFTAVALPVLGGSEDTLTEQSIFFWFERSVVNRLWFRDLTVAPTTNLFWASEANTDCVKVIYFEHVASWGKDVIAQSIQTTESITLIPPLGTRKGRPSMSHYI